MLSRCQLWVTVTLDRFTIWPFSLRSHFCPRLCCSLSTTINDNATSDTCTKLIEFVIRARVITHRQISESSQRVSIEFSRLISEASRFKNKRKRLSWGAHRHPMSTMNNSRLKLRQRFSFLNSISYFNYSCANVAVCVTRHVSHRPACRWCYVQQSRALHVGRRSTVLAGDSCLALRRCGWLHGADEMEAETLRKH